MENLESSIISSIRREMKQDIIAGGDDRDIHGSVVDVKPAGVVSYDLRQCFGSDRRARSKRSYLLSLKLPFLAAQTAWYLAAAWSKGNWTVTLQTVRTVPKSSPIFAACEAGNLQKVRWLLASGQASTHDQDVSGKITPFEVLLSQCQTSKI